MAIEDVSFLDGCRVAEASVAMLHEMNQHVALGIRRGDVGDMAEPADLVRGYNVVLATGQKLVELLRLDKACEEEDAGFFVGVSRGTTAFMFANLHKHRYTCLVGLSCLCACASGFHVCKPP